MNYEFELKGGMDAGETFFSGQAFRWKKCGDKYEAIVGSSKISCFMQNNILVAQTSGESLEFWQHYFAADLDYDALRQSFCMDSRLKPCVEFAKGIRVLRQPFFETMCSFIISQNNNIPRITGIIERMCQTFGEKIDDNSYAFPTAQALADKSIEALGVLRSGFRAKYLSDAAKRVASGEINQQLLQQMSTQEARQKLCTIYGVGPKVADCVLLYSLGRSEVIPMDVHMKRAMEQQFPTGLTQSVIPYGGIAQQYIFHYTRLGKKTD